MNKGCRLLLHDRPQEGIFVRINWIAGVLAVGTLFPTLSRPASAREPTQAAAVQQPDLAFSVDDFIRRLSSPTALAEPKEGIDETALDWLLDFRLELTQTTVCHPTEPRCLVIARRLASAYRSELYLLYRQILRRAFERQLKHTYSPDEISVLARFLATSAGRKTPIAFPRSVYIAEMRKAMTEFEKERSRLEIKYKRLLETQTKNIGQK